MGAVFYKTEISSCNSIICEVKYDALSLEYRVNNKYMKMMCKNLVSFTGNFKSE